MAKYRTVAQVLKRKDGKGTYIKVQEDVVLKKGQLLNLTDPRKLPDELLALGKISEEIAEKMRARVIPDFVKFDITVKSE